jgi:protoporphyrinogen oxidase
MTEQRKTAVIIGAGPAGLTAALELLRKTDVRPIVLEAGDVVGGISRTVDVDGYRMDIGGHRFFSKSDWVMDWWREILPLEPTPDVEGDAVTISYRNRHRRIAVGEAAAAPVSVDPQCRMLLRRRLSRIYYLRRFFDYPIKLNLTTLANLGPWRCVKAGASYAWASLFPRRVERSLEDFLVNRFGGELYRTFFKSYTEKVWGVPCTEISAEWGAQRIKGLSLTRAVLHALRAMVGGTPELPQATAQTSLIERFLYPRLGPGQLWEIVARMVEEGGGEVRLRHAVDWVSVADGRVVRVAARDLASGARTEMAADYVISTMPIKDLIASLDPPAPIAVARVAAALPYRDFITVGVLATRMRGASVERSAEGALLLPDNWVYVQEPDVRLGRLQIFNNWSPALVADPSKVWLGLEYFCSEGDDLWQLPDPEMEALAVAELAKIGLVATDDVLRAHVIRVPKAYPAYFGAYAEFATVRGHVDGIANLFLVGRNGMHRYNNQDHSMLTAKLAVECIAGGSADKSGIWDVNVDDDYHEAKST